VPPAPAGAAVVVGDPGPVVAGGSVEVLVVEVPPPGASVAGGAVVGGGSVVVVVVVGSGGWLTVRTKGTVGPLTTVYWQVAEIVKSPAKGNVTGCVDTSVLAKNESGTAPPIGFGVIDPNIERKSPCSGVPSGHVTVMTTVCPTIGVSSSTVITASWA
jgi:hypothetical protein